ncbi:MAG: hypothetical protein PHC54_03845 [Candidatus Omnitrophica bacterium]|nr:hypothetical protein [Candidatus Omnitrophota bacterium]MDD5592317.1 hypothetical protein [Candidatus Omnitrophota bacterium]
MTKIKAFLKSRNIQAAFISAITAVVISCIGIFINWSFNKESNRLSREAIKISKEALKFNMGTQRAHLYINLIGPPKIKIERYDGGFKMECYLTVTNIGKTDAKNMAYKISIKPEFLNAPENKADMKVDMPGTPFLIKPGDTFWPTAGFEVVATDPVQKEKLIKEIEDGKLDMLLDVNIQYLDAITLKEYSTSALIRFNKKSSSILKSNDV